MKLVICEGADDESVLEGICNASGIDGLMIENCKGRHNLERFVSELRIRPEFTRQEVESVAIIIDAEINSEASWQKVRNAVQLGFALPLPAPGEFAGQRPRIGGFVVSGAEGRGMIEDLCLAAVSDQPGYPCLQEYFKCLSERTDKKEYRSKAKFRAWMASQTEYESHVGLAARHGFIPWERPAFASLREFLTKL
jgi:hypothetical protein